MRLMYFLTFLYDGRKANWLASLILLIFVLTCLPCVSCWTIWVPQRHNSGFFLDGIQVDVLGQY